MNILFWDIDGTLIRTSKAGLFAFEQATNEIWKTGIDFEKIETAGMTDNHIAAEIIAMITSREASPAEIQELTKRYEQLLPVHLYDRGGRLMPFVREILDYLDERDDFLSLLLTGNSRTGSEIKLRYFELDHYFDFGRSAFCDSYSKRIDIARCAVAAVGKLQSSLKNSSIFVIGDTPHDIRCGEAIGAYTIAVATGGYSLDDLVACSPWWAVKQLPAAEAFVGKIQLASKSDE